MLAVLAVAVVAVACASDAGPVTVDRGASAVAASAEVRSTPVVTYRGVRTATDTYLVDASLPVVEGVPADVASAIDRYLAGWFDAELARFEREDRAFVVAGADAEGFAPGFLEVRPTGAATASLLSVAFTVTSMHQGMAHPETVVETVTFELSTGRAVELPELFVPGSDVYGTVSAEVVPLLVAALDPTGDGWAEPGVRAGAAADPDLLRRFVVDAAGLTLHFDQYQVAPGAAGPQVVTLGWDGLLDVLPPSPLLRAALDPLG